MSYNFKKIIDLDLVNEVPEGANVLIETDGATKRLPSTAIKPAPIQPDFTQNDPTAPDYVKNRTHYEETAVVNEPLNITWDGNTEGLVSFYDEGWRATFCKVSDATPTLEQLQSGGVIAVSYVPHDGNAPSYDSYELSNMSGSADIAMWLNKDGVGVAVAFVDGAVPPFEGAVPFPEKGLYLTSSNAYGDDADTYASSLTTTEPVEHTKTVVKKLDKKYLPDDIGGGGIKIFYSDVNLFLYHDEELTMEMIKDELFEAMMTKPIIVKTVDGNYYVPREFNFANDWGSVRLDGSDYSTKELASAPPV